MMENFGKRSEWNKTKKQGKITFEIKNINQMLKTWWWCNEYLIRLASNIYQVDFSSGNVGYKKNDNDWL